jgi:hypothetical protein
MRFSSTQPVMESPTPVATARSGSIITSSARQITVYTNSLGDIVIRQAASGYGDKAGDDVIVVRQASIPALLDAVASESEAARSPAY